MTLIKVFPILVYNFDNSGINIEGVKSGAKQFLTML